MANQLLDLKTLTERYTVRVDGKSYELRPTARFSVVEIIAFPDQTARLSELATRKQKLSADESEEIEQLLDDICRVILDAPASVHERLTGAQRMQICTAFTLLRQATSPARRRATGGTRTTAPKTGARSSHGSRGSMVGNR